MTTETIEVPETVTSTEQRTVCDCCGQAETPGLDEEVFEVVVDPEIVDTAYYYRPTPDWVIASVARHPSHEDRMQDFAIEGARADLCGRCCDRLFGGGEFDGVVNNVEGSPHGGVRVANGQPLFANERVCFALVLGVVAFNAAVIVAAGGVSTTALAVVGLIVGAVGLGMWLERER